MQSSNMGEQAAEQYEEIEQVRVHEAKQKLAWRGTGGGA
jgi:hypothetical protein